MKHVRSNHKLLIGVIAVVLLVIGGSFAVFKQQSDSHARSQAQSAAASFIPAAKTYLTSLGNNLLVLGSPKTSGEAAIDQTATVNKIQAGRPSLRQIKGAGASLPEYKTALSYQAKISALQPRIRASLAANNTFDQYGIAYLALRTCYTNIYNGALNQGDPVTALKNIVINPLQPVQASFAKVTPTPQYATLNKDIQTTLSGYINTANAIIALYASGNLHNITYDYYTPLNQIYIELNAQADIINDMLTSLGNSVLSQAK